MNLDDFDDDLEKAKPGERADGVKLSELPDGDYEMEVAAAELKDTTAGPLFSVQFTILGDKFGGQTYKHVAWFTRKNKATGAREKNDVALNILKKELIDYGFDVNNWTKDAGRPFTAELKKAAAVMQGLRVIVKKKQSGQYHNAYVNGRAKEGDETKDGRPEHFGAADLDIAAPFDVF